MRKQLKVLLTKFIQFHCRARDIYHTCYTLSGLSVAQHLPNGKVDIVGDETNLLVKMFFKINKNH